MARILVADDEEWIRASIAAILRRAGHVVVMAEDGEDALRKFAPSHYDLVITDIIMPRVEGIETLLTLRRREPTVRIIAMADGCGSDQGFYLKAALALGADAILQKPVSAGALRDVVGEALTTPEPHTARLWYRQFGRGIAAGPAAPAAPRHRTRLPVSSAANAARSSAPK